MKYKFHIIIIEYNVFINNNYNISFNRIFKRNSKLKIKKYN